MILCCSIILLNSDWWKVLSVLSLMRCSIVVLLIVCRKISDISNDNGGPIESPFLSLLCVFVLEVVLVQCNV
jgi:hypothetical protein